MGSDAEEGDPQEADADGSDTNDTCGEEEEDDCEEDYVVDWEDLAGDDHQPVDWLEDLVVGEKVATAGGADAVLDLVDTGDEHRGPNDEDNDDEEQSTEELERTEDGLDLDPSSDEPVVTFTRILGSEAFAADEGALFTDQSLKLASVPGVETTFAPLIAAFELALALTVLVELRRRGCCH